MLLVSLPTVKKKWSKKCEEINDYVGNDEMQRMQRMPDRCYRVESGSVWAGMEPIESRLHWCSLWRDFLQCCWRAGTVTPLSSAPTARRLRSASTLTVRYVDFSRVLLPPKIGFHYRRDDAVVLRVWMHGCRVEHI